MNNEEKIKIRIGDRVRFTDENLHIDEPRWFPEVGTIGVVMQDGVDRSLRIQWKKGSTSLNDDWWCPIQAIEKVTSNPFVIIRLDEDDELKVVAKNVRTGETAAAKCNPEDEFDFAVGAKLALSRLFGDEPKPKNNSGNHNEITRKKFLEALIDVMGNGKISKALKDSPILFLMIPVIGKEIEDRLFGKEAE